MKNRRTLSTIGRIIPILQDNALVLADKNKVKLTIEDSDK